MSNTYTTTINAMYTIPSPPGYVVNVLFTVSGTDGTHTAKIAGNCPFTFANDKVITPYAQLTQQIVLGWINGATNNLANYYANIDGQIANMVTPPVIPSNTPLPWAAS